MKSALVVLLASTVLAAACTGSEDVNTMGSGGRSGGGSGGAATGSGGGSGGSIGSGSGGSIGSGGSGTGGARPDGGTDSAKPDTGGGNDAGDGLYHYEKDIAYVLRQNCGGCHLAPTVMGSFDMKILDDFVPGPDAYPTIMGTVTSAHSGCAGLDATKKRIVAGKPNNSLLYIKISTANPPSGCGAHMPMGASLPQLQIDKIKLWITQGALR